MTIKFKAKAIHAEKNQIDGTGKKPDALKTRLPEEQILFLEFL